MSGIHQLANKLRHTLLVRLETAIIQSRNCEIYTDGLGLEANVKLQDMHEGKGVHSTRRRRDAGNSAGNATCKACSERLKAFHAFLKVVLGLFGCFVLLQFGFFTKLLYFEVNPAAVPAPFLLVLPLL